MKQTKEAMLGIVQQEIEKTETEELRDALAQLLNERTHDEILKELYQSTTFLISQELDKR